MHDGDVALLMKVIEMLLYSSSTSKNNSVDDECDLLSVCNTKPRALLKSEAENIASILWDGTPDKFKAKMEEYVKRNTTGKNIDKGDEFHHEDEISYDQMTLNIDSHFVLLKRRASSCMHLISSELAAFV